MKSILLALTLWVSLVPFALAQAVAPVTGTDQTLLLEVEGQKITLKEIEDKEINDLRQQLFEQLEARLKHKAVELLKTKHPELNQIPQRAISEAEVKAFYDQNNLAQKGSFEQLAPRIRQFMELQAQAQVDQAILNQAMAKGQVKLHLSQPGEFLIQVPLETAFLWGKADKRTVMLLEFSDYQCPFCARFQPTLANLREANQGKVVFGYRHFPLQFHTEADEAAIAAECARDQGKFPEYHQLLYQNQKQQFPNDLKAYAKQVKIKDQAKFDACLDKDTYRKRVDRDIAVGTQAGVKGTPSFIIGIFDPKTGMVAGEMLSGALPAPQVQEKLDKALAKLR